MSGCCCSFHVQSLSTRSDKVQKQGIAQKKHTVHCTVVTDLDLGEGGQHGDAPLHGEGDCGVHGAGEAHVDQGQHVRGHEGEHVILGVQAKLDIQQNT